MRPDNQERKQTWIIEPIHGWDPDADSNDPIFIVLSRRQDHDNQVHGKINWPILLTQNSKYDEEHEDRLWGAWDSARRADIPIKYRWHIYSTHPDKTDWRKEKRRDASTPTQPKQIH